MVRMRRYYEVDDDDVDERGVVRDGGRVHVPLMLTDGALRDVAARNRAPLFHRPGQVSLTDEQIDIREQARSERSARTSSAWRGQTVASQDLFKLASELAPLLGLASPKPFATRSPASDADPDADDPRQAALAARSRWKSDAWKSRARR
jgi:hypothetical protein